MTITEYKAEEKPKKIIYLDPVKSSNIQAIGYDKDKEILYIMFGTNSVYEYHPVKEHAYESFKNAKSLGKFFYAFIKSNDLYKFKKMGYDTEVILNKQGDNNE